MNKLTKILTCLIISIILCGCTDEIKEIHNQNQTTTTTVPKTNVVNFYEENKKDDQYTHQIPITMDNTILSTVQPGDTIGLQVSLKKGQDTPTKLNGYVIKAEVIAVLDKEGNSIYRDPENIPTPITALVYISNYDKKILEKIDEYQNKKQITKTTYVPIDKDTPLNSELITYLTQK